MKKLITPALAMLMALGLFGCKKEKIVQKTPEKVAVADTITRSKAELGISCAGITRTEPMYPSPVTGLPEGQIFANGVLVGLFPTSTAQMHTILPKSTWKVNASGPGPWPGAYTLVNQNDGNLVLYKGNGANPGTAIWSSNTQWQGGNTQFYLQNDWNMVGYLNYPNGAVWDTGTYQFHCGGPQLPQIYLFLRGDGDLQIIGRIGNFSQTKMGILASTQTAGGVVNPNHTMVRYVGSQNGWNIY